MKFLYCMLPALASAVLASLAPNGPVLCMVSPTLTIGAGENITLSVQSSQASTCQATLSFTNKDFMPVIFDIKPLSCFGTQTAKIAVPTEVPNGEAFLLWDCAGDTAPMCVRVVLTDGSADVANLPLYQEALLACPVASTTLMTLTTSSTSTVGPISSTAFLTSLLSFTNSSSVSTTASSTSSAPGQILSSSTTSLPAITTAGLTSSLVSRNLVTPTSVATGSAISATEGSQGTCTCAST